MRTDLRRHGLRVALAGGVSFLALLTAAGAQAQVPEECRGGGIVGVIEGCVAGNAGQSTEDPDRLKPRREIITDDMLLEGLKGPGETKGGQGSSDQGGDQGGGSGKPTAVVVGPTGPNPLIDVNGHLVNDWRKQMVGFICGRPGPEKIWIVPKLVRGLFDETKDPSESTRTLEDGTVEITDIDPKKGTKTVTRIRPDGSVEIIEYLADGSRRVSIAYPDGRTEFHDYGPDGKKAKKPRPKPKSTRTELPDGTVKIVDHDPESGTQTETVVRPDGAVRVTETFEDGSSRESFAYPDGRTAYHEYDRNGRRIETGGDGKGGHSLYANTGDGRVISMEDPGGEDEPTSTQIADESGVTTAEVEPGDDGSASLQHASDDGVTNVYQGADGGLAVSDGDGNLTEFEPGDGFDVVRNSNADGEYTETLFDSEGNPILSETVSTGDKEPGQEYFETVLGGTDWDSLPKSYKSRYAASEQQLRDNAAAQAAREATAMENEAERQRDLAEKERLASETSAKVAEIEAERQAALARHDKLMADQERRAELNAVKEKSDKLKQAYQEAVDRGDMEEARRIEQEQIAHEEASMDVLQFTPEEEAEMERQSAVRQALATRINREAARLSEAELIEAMARQTALDSVTGSPLSLVSNGLEFQESAKKANRIAKTEEIRARAELQALETMLNDPNLSLEERNILVQRRDMAERRQQSASQLLTANDRLTAVAYTSDLVDVFAGGALMKGAGAAAKVTTKVARVGTQAGATGASFLAGHGAQAAVSTGRRFGSTVAHVLERDAAETAAALAKYGAEKLGPDRIEALASGFRTVTDVTADAVVKVLGEEGAKAAARRAEQAGVVVGKAVDLLSTDVVEAAKKGMANRAAAKTATAAKKAAALESRAVRPDALGAHEEDFFDTVRLTGGDSKPLNVADKTVIQPHGDGAGAKTLTGADTTIIQPHGGGAGAKTLTGADTTIIQPHGGGAGAKTLTGADTTIIQPHGGGAGAKTLTGADTTIIQPHVSPTAPPVKVSVPKPDFKPVRPDVNLPPRAANDLIVDQISKHADELGSQTETMARELLQAGHEIPEAVGASLVSGQQARNLQKALNSRVDEARRLGVREAEIRDLLGNADAYGIAPVATRQNAIRGLEEQILRKQGFEPVSEEAAAALRRLVTRAHTGQATPDDVAELGSMIQAAADKGEDAFEALARQGYHGYTDGWQPIADTDGIDALRRLAQQNGLPGAGAVNPAAGQALKGRVRVETPSASSAGASHGPKAYGDRTSSLEELKEFAANPRIRFQGKPQGTASSSHYDPVQYGHVAADEAEDLAKAYAAIPEAQRLEHETAVRALIEEAAAVGDHWAQRALKDLNGGNFSYFMEPRMKKGTYGLAARSGPEELLPLGASPEMHLNPVYYDAAGTPKLVPPEFLATVFVHEYAHIYKGAKKAAALKAGFNGEEVSGAYNEVRAMLVQRRFQKNMELARSLNGKPYKAPPEQLDRVAKVAKALANEGVTDTAARGVRLRGAMQEALINDPFYSQYYSKPDKAIKLSAYKGGSIAQIRKEFQTIADHVDKTMAHLSEAERFGQKLALYDDLIDAMGISALKSEAW